MQVNSGTSGPPLPHNAIPQMDRGDVKGKQEERGNVYIFSKSLCIYRRLDFNLDEN